MLDVSVSFANVSARALVDGGCGGEFLISRTFADWSGVDYESSSGERVELSDGTLPPRVENEEVAEPECRADVERCESGCDRVEYIRCNSWAAVVISMEPQDRLAGDKLLISVNGELMLLMRPWIQVRSP
jgi:hypothetical protein